MSSTALQIQVASLPEELLPLVHQEIATIESLHEPRPWARFPAVFRKQCCGFGFGLVRYSGAWTFVSHAPRDLRKVREIRNELKRRGHHPRLFFRKCLEDDDLRKQ